MRTALPVRLARRLAPVAGCLSLLAGATAGTVAGAGPAVAAAANCEGGVNGFVDIPDTLSGTVVGDPYYTPEPRNLVLTLQHGNVGGLDRGWAKIEHWVMRGDQVWMDVTRNGGSSWLQCGPFTATESHNTSHTPMTTPAYPTSADPNVRFRACVSRTSVNNYPIHCTPWW
ncbi:hypothetical protein [Streptomyces viridochromogenes]|nr:hypothetical protein [Streptomyces viridochromogenes]